MAKFSPWFKCDCGKLHLATHIDWTTKCSCSAPLKVQALAKVKRTNHKEVSKLLRQINFQTRRVRG